MQIQIIDNIERLLYYKAEWDNMLKQTNNGILFLELDWIVLWWRFFGGKHKLFVLIITKDQEIVGICPLMKTNKRFYNEINFIGGRQSGRMDFILKDELREEVLKNVFIFLRDLKGNNIIELHGMCEKSENYSLLKNLIIVNRVPYIYSNRVFYFLNLRDKEFSSHFENRFGKKTRQTMSKKQNKLKYLGNLEYKRISQSDIDGVFEIHEKRWLRKAGNSSFSKAESKEFYKELISYNNIRFRTIIDAITLNNRIISFIYGFEYNNKYYFIRIAHDDDFYFLSPGELIFKKKIEECFSSKISSLDFGAGYEPYKARWTDDYEKIYTTTMPSNSLQSNLIFYIKYWTSIKMINAMKNSKIIDRFRKHYFGKLKFLLSKENISDKITTIRRSAYQIGLLEYIIQHFINLTSKIFSHKQYLILEKYISSVETFKNEIHVKEATIDDLDGLSKVMNKSQSDIIRRLVNKHKCYIAFYDGEIIYYCWVNRSSIVLSDRELYIPLEDSDDFIYEAFIKKDYKNEYSYTHILSSIFTMLYKENCRRCYIIINASNKSLENEIYKKIFDPKYKVLEKRILKTIKHYIVDLKL